MRACPRASLRRAAVMEEFHNGWDQRLQLKGLAASSVLLAITVFRR
jgi:hypothetical protein